MDDALSLTETVAVWEEVTEATFAVNDAVEAPDATVTLAGTVTALLLLPTVTPMPVDGAAELSDTVHVVVPAPVYEALPHENAVIEGKVGDVDTGGARLMEVFFEIDP